MAKKRSPNVKDSPFAEAWLSDHPDAKKNATRIVRLMKRSYGGDYHGYINRNEPMAEYRFAPIADDPTIWDVHIVVRQKHATVRFYLRHQLKRGELRSGILKSATGTDLDAIDFKVDNLGSLDPLTEFISSTSTFSANLLMSESDLRADFEKRISKARSSSPAQRKSRLDAAPKKPERMTVSTSVFKRNADVVVEVLERAAGSCEYCKQPAPFTKRVDREPYLEVHHRKPLAKGGDDTVENAIALCPNCHRWMHFGIVEDQRH